MMRYDGRIFGRFPRRGCWRLLLSLSLLGLGACGGGSNSGGGAATITSVTISGPNFTQAGLCSNFTATVSGTGNFNDAVQWYANGTLGGTAADGLISSSGDYCAPSTPPATNPVSIKAIAIGDTTKFGVSATTVIGIQISPTQAQLYVGNTQQFTATITGPAGSAVVWQVNGITGGNSAFGAISTSGLYTAPAQVTNQAILVEAASSESNTIYSQATIFVSGRIVISPANPQISYGATQQFTAQVIGASNAPINWGTTYGQITSTGLYTATSPESPDTISASTTDANGSTTVQIVGPTPVISSLSPQPATAGETLTITGQNFSGLLTAIFSDAIGGQLPANATIVNATTATVTVPQGSVTGNFYAQVAEGTLPVVQSNVVQFQRLARLRIRAPQNDVGAGESIDFKYALLGDSTPQTVTFTADQGSFSGATYLAPASVASDTIVHVTGCIAGTEDCDTQVLSLRPFRISPAVALVSLGGTLQLSDVGSASGINWNLLAGGGSLQSAGLYSAGTTYQSGGPAIVSASNSTVAEQTSVGVTGAFPGLLNRIYDYLDQNSPTMSTDTLGLAVNGNRMFVAATNHEGAYTDSYFWIDVYDITDPLHPTWVTAVESNSSGQIFVAGQYLYSYQNVDLAVPGYPNTITIYSIQSGVPVLQARTANVPQWWDISNGQGVLTLVPLSAPDGTFVEYNLTNGTIASTTLSVTMPSDANYFTPDTAYITGNRMFVSVQNNENTQGYILTYDVSTSPPTLLGSINARSLDFYSSGNLLFGASGGMQIYDISGQLPVQVGYIDGINAKELAGTRLLATTEQQGCQIVNVTNPAQPAVTSILFDGVISACNSGVLVGPYAYAEEGDGGIAIYDASEAGGPIVQGQLYGGPYVWSDGIDMLLQSNSLYVATATGLGGALDIFDTTANPPSLVGSYLDQTQQAKAVQESGNYVYFGMTNNLAVLDVSQPSAPTLVTTLALPMLSLAQATNTLYAGTSNKALTVIDITNPGQPAIVSALSLPDLPLRLRVSGNVLFVADNAAGLLIYNIANPRAPVLLSTLNSFTLAADVAIQGTTAYVAADVDGLGVVDISNPAQPVLLSKTGLSRIDPFYTNDSLNEALSVAVNDGIVYVGTLNDNMLVFGLDCSNPAVPRIVSTYAYADAIESLVGSLLFNGTELFVAGGSGSNVYPVTQVDMSQPLDSINQYFPPAALQSPAPIMANVRSALANHPKARTANRFHLAQ